MSYDCPPIDNHIGLMSAAAFCASVKYENEMLHNSSKPLLGLVPSTEGTKYHTHRNGTTTFHVLFLKTNFWISEWLLICMHSLEVKITQ